jgi:hypothetical protein
MTYGVIPGIDCTISFTGDTFETEDQRNWTDGSFKTYSTPQALPVPAVVEKGTLLVQEVRLSLSGRCSVKNRRTRPLRLNAGRGFESPGRMPEMGLLHRVGCPLRGEVVARLTSLDIGHLRYDIDLHKEIADIQMEEIGSLCGSVQTRAELALFLGSEYTAELAEMGRLLACHPLKVRRILLFSTDQRVTPVETIISARKRFEPLLPETEIGAGTDYYFIEINRKPPDASCYDVLCYSASPQVHTFDDRAVMENLEGLRECIESAGILSRGKPVVLSPYTLRPRKRNESPDKFGGPDPRQKELFTAAWMVGVLCGCCSAGLHSLTLGGVVGPEGLMSEDGSVLYPVYHVFTSGINSGAAVTAEIRLSGEHGIALLRAERPDGDILLVANLTATGHSVEFSELPEGCGCALLDDKNLSSALSDPLFWDHHTSGLSEITTETGVLDLGSYAVARIKVPRIS